MNIEILKNFKECLELSSLKKKIAKLSNEDKKKINKILNFAISWWLRDVDKSDETKHQKALSMNDAAKLEKFKQELGISILKALLKSPLATVELYCDNTGILEKCIQESNCSFINSRIPFKSRMKIDQRKIFIKEESDEKYKLAFDVNKVYHFGKNPDISTNQLIAKEKDGILIARMDAWIAGQEKEYVIPSDFVPSKYDFLDDNQGLVNHQKNHR